MRYSFLRRAQIASALLVVSFALFLGCTKEKAASNKLLEGAIVSKIPSTSVAFFATSSKLDTYQELKKSTSYKQALNLGEKLESFMSGDSDPKFERAKRIVTALKASGFLPKSGGEGEIFSESIFFIDSDTTKLSAGLYAEGASGANFTKSLSDLSTELGKEGFTNSPIEFQGAKGFEFVSKDTDNIAPKIYALASNTLIAVSTAKGLAERLFSSDAKPGMPDITAGEGFKRCSAEIASRESEYAFSFIDFEKGLVVLSALSPADVPSSDISKFPFSTAALSSGFDGAISSEFALSLKPGVPNDTVKVLAASSGKDLSSLGPDDAILFLGLDGSVIRSMLSRAEAKDALTQIPDNAKTLVAALEKSSGVAISLRRGSGENIFPDLAFGISSEDPKAIEASLKSNFSDGLGIPANAWQQKDVDGAKVDYMITPLGIGSYFSTKGDNLFVSSSEAGIKSLVSSSKGAPLPAQFTKRVSDSNPFLVVDLNFQALAEVIEGVQGSLAMFTGGQAPFDSAPLAELRSMDSISIAASAKEDLVHVFARYHEKK